MTRRGVAAGALGLAACALGLGAATASAQPLSRGPQQVRVALAPAVPEVVDVTPTQASPDDTVTVNGSGFPAGTRAQVYLDGPDHPLGASVVVGGDGTFTATETIPAGATQDLHQICAQVNSASPACAQLQVDAAATPTPAPTPTPVATAPAPTVAPTPAATAAPASNGLLGSLFPWILIPIGILVLLAVIAIVLLVRGRRSPADGAGPPPPVYGDPRGAGRPTVTHYSPRGYVPPDEPGDEPIGGPAPRGYRRPRMGGPAPRDGLPGGGDRPALPPRGDGGDDDDFFSTPPNR